MLAYSSNWLIFFPVAFSLYVALRLSHAGVDCNNSPWALTAVRGLIATMFVFTFLAVGIRPSPLTVIWIGLVAAGAIVIALKTRHLKRSAFLLTALRADNLADQQALVGFFRQENAGWLRRKASQLGRDLTAGVSWERALENRGVARTTYERLVLRLRGLHGAHEFRDRGDESASFAPLQVEAQVERLLGRLLIFSWIIFVPGLIAFLLTFILPTIQQMFEEFGLSFPASTQILVDVSSWSIRNNLHILIAAGSVFLMLLAMLAALVWFSPALLQLPLLRWFAKSYYQNVGFVALASLLERGQDVLSACRGTARLVPIRHIAQRYGAAASMMEYGASPVNAFLKSGLLSRKEIEASGLGLLDGDPVWGLREMARWKTERLLYRYAIIVQVLVVVVTLTLALIVGLVAVGLISALCTMITSLS